MVAYNANDYRQVHARTERERERERQTDRERERERERELWSRTIQMIIDR